MARIARLRMRTDVCIRPSVESALLDMREIVGRKIIAEPVALLHDGPQRIRARIKLHADGIARPCCEQSMSAAIRIVFRNCSSNGRLTGRNIRLRANGYINLLAVGREDYIARPVLVISTAWQISELLWLAR